MASPRACTRTAHGAPIVPGPKDCADCAASSAAQQEIRTGDISAILSKSPDPIVWLGQVARATLLPAALIVSRRAERRASGAGCLLLAGTAEGRRAGRRRACRFPWRDPAYAQGPRHRLRCGWAGRLGGRGSLMPLRGWGWIEGPRSCRSSARPAPCSWG